MPARVPVHVVAGDPISQAGMASQLRSIGDLYVVDELDDAGVEVVVADSVDETAVQAVRQAGRAGKSVVLVATFLDANGLMMAVEAGAVAALRRADARSDQLASVVRAAASGHGSLPPDLLGSLLGQVGKLQRNVLEPRGLRFNGFTEREVSVLRLVADGHDTNEIAEQLAYSERTVKNVIHDVTARFNLRNRSHAVAYALRSGVI